MRNKGLYISILLCGLCTSCIRYVGMPNNVFVYVVAEDRVQIDYCTYGLTKHNDQFVIRATTEEDASLYFCMYDNTDYTGSQSVESYLETYLPDRDDFRIKRVKGKDVYYVFLMNRVVIEQQGLCDTIDFSKVAYTVRQTRQTPISTDWSEPREALDKEYLARVMRAFREQYPEYVLEFNDDEIHRVPGGGFYHQAYPQQLDISTVPYNQATGEWQYLKVRL